MSSGNQNNLQNIKLIVKKIRFINGIIEAYTIIMEWLEVIKTAVRITLGAGITVLAGAIILFVYSSITHNSWYFYLVSIYVVTAYIIMLIVICLVIYSRRLEADNERILVTNIQNIVNEEIDKCGLNPSLQERIKHER